LEAWQAANFTAGEISAGSAAPATDFEHDGMANLLEYAFAKNPRVADLTGIAPNVSTNKMQISFRCDASCTDITYIVQASSNLSTWNEIARSAGGAKTAEVSGSGCAISDTGTGVRTVTVTEAAAFTGKRFLRGNQMKTTPTTRKRGEAIFGRVGMIGPLVRSARGEPARDRRSHAQSDTGFPACEPRPSTGWKACVTFSQKPQQPITRS
jgi:hypothetical protein